MEKIKESLESGNTIVVCDTNVYLHIYSYSPNYSEYAISCLDVIKDYLRMPSMIALEYTKHYQYCFKQMGNRIIDAKNNYIRQITKAQDSTLSVNMNLKKLGFVEIEDLNESLNQQYATMMNTVIEFFENRGGALDLLANGWGEVDRVYEIYEYMVNNNQILSAFSQLDLYRICEEGARRYKKQLPPGYKDDNGKKNGFNKYGDLIWWKEVIQYAKRNKCDVYLVTDDVKEDWWGNDNKLRSELVTEFKKTGQTIYAFTANTFYEAIGTEYNISVPDMVQCALNLTDADYCERISDNVFDTIIDKLLYNGMDYIVGELTDSGAFGLDEFELLSYSYESSSRLNREGSDIYYLLEYNVTLSAYSYDYWGKDDETKNNILSPENYHEFKGRITVELKRKADIFVDFVNEDSFEAVEIIDGSLEESLYKRWDEIDGYTTCPKCGNDINYQNDAGDGFCLDCTE